jgi:DNA-binding FadR family transcriptional regulator
MAVNPFGERPPLAVIAAESEPQLRPIVVPQVYEQVAESIKAQIRAGAFRPSDRLPSERDLARRFEVGRPSVREALASLKVDGIVVTRAGAGSFVAADALERVAGALGPSIQNMSPVALLEVREHLEPAAARLAAMHARRDPRAEELLESMESVLDVANPADRRLWSETDRLFHQQIGLMADNPVLAEICRYVAVIMSQPLWRRLRDESLFQEDRISRYRAEHRTIYEAVVEGDAEAAAFFAARHVRAVRRHIVNDPVDGRP